MKQLLQETINTLAVGIYPNKTWMEVNTLIQKLNQKIQEIPSENVVTGGDKPKK